jgi:hypothetical protein
MTMVVSEMRSNRPMNMDIEQLRGWALFIDRAMVVSVVVTVLAIVALGVTTWLSFRFSNALLAHEQAAFHEYKVETGKHATAWQLALTRAQARTLELEHAIAANEHVTQATRESAAANERARTAEINAEEMRKRVEELGKTVTEASDEQLGRQKEIEQLTLQLRQAEGERDRINADLAADRRLSEGLKIERDQLTERLASMLGERDKLAAALQGAAKEQEAKTTDLQKEIDRQRLELTQLAASLAAANDEKGKLFGDLTEEQKLSAEQKAAVMRMTAELAGLKDELARLNAALDASEAKSKERQAQKPTPEPKPRPAVATAMDTPPTAKEQSSAEPAAPSREQPPSPLVASLKKYAGTKAAIYVLDEVPDGPAVGSAILGPLTEAGWAPLTWTWTGVSGIMGVVVLVKDGIDSATDEAASTLVDTLRLAGFNAVKGNWPADWRRFRGTLNGPQIPNPTDAPIRIVVGSKPR